MKEATLKHLSVQRKFVKPAAAAAVASVDEQLLPIIDRLMQLQERIIYVGEEIMRRTRLQLLFIFLRVGIAVTFNAYNLALFGANLATGGRQPLLSVGQTVAFYCYHILAHTLELLITIVAFSWTYDAIEHTARLINRLNIYCADAQLRSRLAQFVLQVQMNLRPYTVFGLYPLNASLLYAFCAGTTTYIIILLQYGLENELDVSYPLGSKAHGSGSGIGIGADNNFTLAVFPIAQQQQQALNFQLP